MPGRFSSDGSFCKTEGEKHSSLSKSAIPFPPLKRQQPCNNQVPVHLKTAEKETGEAKAEIAHTFLYNSKRERASTRRVLRNL
jgi:hypothetical protein